MKKLLLCGFAALCQFATSHAHVSSVTQMVTVPQQTTNLSAVAFNKVVNLFNTKRVVCCQRWRERHAERVVDDERHTVQPWRAEPDVQVHRADRLLLGRFG